MALSKLNIALTYYKQQKFNLALEKLKEINLEHSLEEYLKSLYFQWKIVATHQSQESVKKLEILNQVILNEMSLEKKKKAQTRAQSIIKTLRFSETESLIKKNQLTTLNKWLIFHSAQYLVKEKKFKKALVYFQKLLLQTKDNSSLEKTAHQYIQALTTRTKVKPKRVGAILPLSGSHKRIGERCLNGLQLGLGLHDTKPSDFELVVMDSKGRPQFIRETVKELLVDHQVIGLVGGLASQVAITLSETAQDFMIPSILLSQKSQLTKDKPFIFQNSINNKHIVQHLVDYLMEEGHKDFAILYPNDRFGVQYSNLFWDYISSKGGNIKGAQIYKQGETDFNNPIKRLTGLYYVKDRDEEYREKLKNWFSKKRSYRNNKQLRNLLPPAVDFTVLFIPDSIKSLHHITPYLAFHDIKGVTLAGTSIWNSNKIVEYDKNQIENIIFADALITKHPQFKESSFYQDFKSTFGYTPSLFEFLSYQSGLALRQVIVSGSDSREELQENLSRLRNLESPIGNIKISKSREFIYPITNFSIKDKAIVSLDP